MSTVKKIALILMAIALLAPAAAPAEARYPAQGSVITDDANVLSQSMAGDIAAYAETLKDHTDVNLHVALVQFLDGEPVQTYTDRLFTRWELGENDLLVLGTAAEDSFATASGAAVKAKLSDASLKSLLYASGFSDAFQSQRYDEAFGALFVAFNDLAEKQYDEKIALNKLFAAYQPSQTAQADSGTAQPDVQAAVQNAASAVVDTTSQLWTSAVNAITHNVENYQNYHEQRNDSTGGLTPAGWIVLAVIALIIFGQSNRARRARRAGGCGCSPIGWIIGGLGLGALFGHRGDGNGDGCCSGRREFRREFRHRDRW